MNQTLIFSALLMLVSHGVASADSGANPPRAPTTGATENAAATPVAGERPATASERSIEFSADNIRLAFDYLDRDGNGSISRDEAARIRGVARNFDRADLDGNNSLSREEFTDAMNRSKAR